MPTYQCCDCGEVKATRCELEAHLNSDHIDWAPYQCFYCSQQGVSTRKPNKQMLKEHVTQRHSNQMFTFLYTDDQANEECLEDMIRRSTSQSPDVASTTPMSISTTSSGGSVSQPFVVSPSPHHPPPKDEIIEEEFRESDSQTLVKEAEKNSDDIKPNLNILGNCSCKTCQQSVPRNLTLIRDHVKLHFKEKTGCVPADLTNLLPSLQQVYCQLLMTSFPSVGASILNDDIPNYVLSTSQKETEDNSLNEMDNGKEQPDITSFGTDVQEGLTTDVTEHVYTTHHRTSANEASSLPISCHVCGKKFLSTNSMHRHRVKSHGILVKWHCKPCNIDFDGRYIGGGFPSHLLRVHLRKSVYVCSLCESQVSHCNIDRHDRRLHGGLGTAVVINNLHRHKSQVETLRKKFIIDVNSPLKSPAIPSTTSKKRLPVKKNSQSIILPECSKNIKRKNKKFDEGKAKKLKSLLCDICNATFASINGLIQHRSQKHHISVKWHCKRCNIDIGSNVCAHLLRTHLGKKNLYECSMCVAQVIPGTFDDHDKQFHGGKALMVYNLNQYKSQLELLRKTLIIDLNSSSSFKRQLATGFKRQNHHHSKNPKKFAEIKVKMTNSVIKCQICDDTVPTLSGLATHRFAKHGIVVKWYCNKCNINIESPLVNKHLLRFHLNKIRVYECNLCDIRVSPKYFNNHDKQYHDGKAQIINNLHHYKSQVDKLRKELIIDLNSSSMKSAANLNLEKKLVTLTGDQGKSFEDKLAQLTVKQRMLFEED